MDLLQNLILIFILKVKNQPNVKLINYLILLNFLNFNG
jgi:hypothetical protein